MNLSIQFGDFKNGDKFKITTSNEFKNEIVEVIESLENGYFILKVNNDIIKEPVHRSIFFRAEYIRN